MPVHHGTKQIPILSRPPTTAPVLLPVCILYDNFTAADGTNLQSRVPAVRPNANTWSVTNGTLTINGNVLESIHTSVVNCLGNFDSGLANCDIRCTFQFPASGASRSAGITFRITDNANYFTALLNLSSNTWKIIETTTSANTDRASEAVTLSAGVPYDVRVVLQDDVITVTLNGAHTLTYTTSVRNTATKHGVRMQNAVGALPDTAEDFIILAAPIVADAIITISGTPLVTSALETGLTHVDNILTFKDATAMARARASLATAIAWNRVYMQAFGGGDAWGWDGTGSPPVEPTNWTVLDKQMANALDISPNIMLICYQQPWWMKGRWNGSTTTPMNSSEAFTDDGSPLANKMTQWLHYVDVVCRRYMIAPYNVRAFLCSGHEFRAHYLGRDGTYNTWRADAQAATAGANADGGLAWFYNQTVAQVRSTAAALGIADNTLKFGGPYAVVGVQGAADSGSVAPGHALYQQPWGSADKQGVKAIEDFLPLATRLDFLAFDYGAYYPKDLVFVCDDWVATQRFTDILTYLKTLLAAAGKTGLPIVVTEWYSKPQVDPGANSQQLRAAIKAETMRRFVEAGVWIPLIWSPNGRGDLAGTTAGVAADSGLITDTTLSDGGQTQAVFDAIKLFHANFSAGTVCYEVANSLPGSLSVLANATDAMLINKVNVSLSVSVDGDVYALDPYEVLLVTR